MPKEQLKASLHEPVTAVLGTRAKVAVLRALRQATSPVSYRELVRRCGMAYGSVDLAVGELTAVGLVEEVDGGRERRVHLQGGHRLAAAVSALLQVEADFFPALRIELRTVLQPLAAHGLVSAVLVGAVSRREEGPGDAVEMVLIARDSAALAHCEQHIAQASPGLRQRFGATLRVIGYDAATARAMWEKRTPGALRTVADSELLVGASLLSVLESAGGVTGPA